MGTLLPLGRHFGNVSNHENGKEIESFLFFSEREGIPEVISHTP